MGCSCGHLCVIQQGLRGGVPRIGWLGERCWGRLCMRLHLILGAAALALAAPLVAQTSVPAAAQENPATRAFHQLLDEHYAWLLRENPTYATALGVHDYDERLPDL